MTSALHLHDQFCEYASIFKNNTPRTIQAFRHSFHFFVRETQITSIQEIDQPLIEQFLIHGKLHRQWSPKTIRNHLQYLSVFLDWCVTRQYIDANLTKQITKPKLPKRVPKSLNKEQAITLLDWAKHYDYRYPFERPRALCIIAFFIFTGVRLRELYNLKMMHVSVHTKTITIRSGKGDKDRLIPINLRLGRIIEGYLAARETYGKTTSAFFASSRGDRPMGQMAIKRLVEKLRHASGIYFYPHLLRHTFATLMIEGGCDIYSLSKMMGHSDIQTTTLYLSASTHHLQRQIGKHPLC